MLKKKVINQKKEYNIPQGKITYSDLNKPARALFSKKYLLSGKPDYVIQNKNKLIPIELKTGSYNSPKKNHIFQLAAYCQLLEDNYNVFVPYGILVYNNQTQHKINYNPRLRFELENAIKNMRSLLKTKKITRNHNDPHKCINCSMRNHCSQKIK